MPTYIYLSNILSYPDKVHTLSKTNILQPSFFLIFFINRERKCRQALFRHLNIIIFQFNADSPMTRRMSKMAISLLFFIFLPKYHFYVRIR